MLRLSAAVFSCLFLFAVIGPAAAEGRPPNIVVILADDMGYSDIGCFGGEIRTPNLDALAAGGVRFTQFYNTARCCPTRAALLTGLYSHQAGIGHMMEDRRATAGEAYAGELGGHAATLAEVLRPAGYATYAVGKWHVTAKTAPKNAADRGNWPLQRGFERFYGTIHGAGSFYDPNTLARDNAFVSPYADPEYQPEAFYYTDAISDHAVRWIGEHAVRTPQRPFLLYMAYTAAHWPMHAKEADIARYRGKYDGGYEPVRRARVEKMRGLGLLDPRWEVSAQTGDWEAVANREWESRCMEVFAAMVDSMDQGIGRVLEALRCSGQWENTLVFFLQDNGGCAEMLGRNQKQSAVRADHPTLPPMEAGALQRDMIPKQTRDGYPVRQGVGVMPGPPDTFIAYGRDWANVSNTPFREYKHWEHEGGISTPLIAHWPAGIPTARAGSLERQPGHLIDIMATCVEVAGARYPAQRDGRAVAPMEGVSLVPALAGRSLGRMQPLFWEHEGNRAVRVGDWKLVSMHPRGWELYDMAADRTEMHDFAAQHPERVAEMAALWSVWAQRVGVHPWPIEAKKSGKAGRRGESGAN